MKKKIKLLLYFFLVFVLLLTPFDWRGFLILEKKEASAAVALTNVSNLVTNTQVGANTLHQINFTTYTTIPSDGKIVITFPSGFNVSGATFNSWSGFDGGQSISINSQEVTVTRDSAGTDSAASGKYIKLSNIVNTATPNTNYTVIVETRNSSDTTLDGPTTSFYSSICTNSSFTNTYHIPWTSTVSVSGKHTTKFTTASAIPNDGKIKITFPGGFDVSSATFDSWSGFDGGQSINIASQTITITRDGLGTPSAAGDKYIVLDNITNHSTPSSNYYVIIETTDSLDVNIQGSTSIRFSINDTGLGLANTPWPIFAHDVKHSGRTTTNAPSYPTLKWKYSATNDMS